MHRCCKLPLLLLVVSLPIAHTAESAAQVVSSWKHLSKDQISAIHKRIDSNSDGKVSKEEIHKYAEDMRRKRAKMNLDGVMASFDKDGDGKLSVKEFVGDAAENKQAGYEERAKEKEAEFKELDLDKDNFVDIDELPLKFHHPTNNLVEERIAAQSIKAKDKDGDGVLSMEEFWGAKLTKLKKDDEPGRFQLKRQFDLMDTDRTKTLGLKEMKVYESGAYELERAIKKFFKDVDADSDKTIDVSEWEKAHKDTTISKKAEEHILHWHHHSEL